MRLVTFLGAAMALLPLACGTDHGAVERFAEADAPIVGGIEDDGHPYVVGVGDEFNGPWCSATLISPQTVLTAAHCALGITRVYFGKTLQSSAVADMEVIHPLYVEDGESPDLALIRLAAPVDQQAAPLFRQTLQNTPEFVGPDWTWVGFGINDPGNQSGFGVRRVTTIPLAGVGPQNFPVPISANYVSYVVNSSSPCFGDSGGPAFHISSGVEHAAAVASWVGDDACSTFGAHTRADQTMIASWIQGVLDSFEPGGVCRNDGSCNDACNLDGSIGDPDCHQSHCVADNICALACVAPVDPDCAGFGVDHCVEDGVCDPNCAPPDVDCTMSSVVATTAVTVGPGPNVATSVGPGVTTTTVGPTSTAATTGGGQTGAGGNQNPARYDGQGQLYGRGCGCRAAGGSESHGQFALLLAAVALGVARRRRSDGACQGPRP